MPALQGHAVGVGFGIAAAFAWAFYNIGADVGRAQGFSSADLTLIRFIAGAAVMVVLLRFLPERRKGASGRQLIWLVLTAGPTFAILVNLGFGFAPLSHAVVISPGMSMLAATGLSWFIDREQIQPTRVIGIALLLAGLILIATGPDTQPNSDGPAWLGDLCFVGSGTLWGVFTWLMGRWKLDAVRVTGQIAVASAALFLPGYLLFAELPDLPLRFWAMQVIYQGVLGGALAIVVYAASVVQLGASRAGLFPALVPPLAIVIAIPLTGLLPTLLEVAGIALVSFGMLIALGLVVHRWRLA